jgi:hypothetical protein
MKTKTAATDSAALRRAGRAGDQSTTRCQYNFNRPVQGVTPEQQQATDDIVIQLEDIKTTARPCTTASACKFYAITAMADRSRLTEERSKDETCEAFSFVKSVH